MRFTDDAEVRAIREKDESSAEFINPRFSMNPPTEVFPEHISYIETLACTLHEH